VVQHRAGHREPDGGVHDRVQLRALRRVGEHERAECRPVQRAVGHDDRKPEGGLYARERGRPWRDDLAREHVRVDERDARGLKPRGHGRLARRDSARQANHWMCVLGHGQA
jgi:hypothetical protein